MYDNDNVNTQLTPPILLKLLKVEFSEGTICCNNWLMAAAQM